MALDLLNTSEKSACIAGVSLFTHYCVYITPQKTVIYVCLHAHTLKTIRGLVASQ